MSFPKYSISPYSSSFSKKPLRLRNSGTSRLLPIESSVSKHQQQQKLDRTTFAPQNGPVEESLMRQHEGGQSIVPQPQHQFNPFFILVKDTNSSEHYHPTIHYIFSDDDIDIITEAAFRSLETSHGLTEKNFRPPEEQVSREEAYDGNELDDGQANVRKPSLLPPPIPGMKERYIILNMDSMPDQAQAQAPGQLQSSDINQTAAGVSTSSISAPSTQSKMNQIPSSQPGQTFRITSAHSLTPDWQVLNTQPSSAPTFDNLNDALNGEPSAHPANGALMLHIEGTPGLPRYVPNRDNKDLTNRRQTLEDMMDQFERRMAELRRVIEAGGPGMKETRDVQEDGDGEAARDSDRHGAAASKRRITAKHQSQVDNHPSRRTTETRTPET